MATLLNLTGKVRITGAAILGFIGPPHVAVEWRILAGTATLTPFSLMTDAFGRASCKFEAGGLVETVTVGVAYIEP